MWGWIIAGIIALLIMYKTVRVVPQGKLWVVERFGRYHRTLTPGMQFLIPIVDRIARRVTTKEQFADFPPQSVITKDNVTIEIDAVVFYKVENDVEDNAISFNRMLKRFGDWIHRNDKKNKSGKDEEQKDKDTRIDDKRRRRRRRAAENKEERQNLVTFDIENEVPDQENEELESEQEEQPKDNNDDGLPNAAKYVYGVEKPNVAIETLTATTLRNVIGEMELDNILSARKKINEKMSKELDQATDAWGIKVTRVEVKNINPPQSIRESMEKQMKAKRDKAEQELRAEGHKNAAAFEALAIKEKIEKEAEAQAKAIRMIQEANAEGIRLLKEAGADQNVLTLKSFETMAKVADGKATKIIIPSEIQNLAGTLQALSEVASNKTPKTPEDIEVLNVGKKDSRKEVVKVVPAETEKPEVKAEVKTEAQAKGSTTAVTGEAEEKERKLLLM